MEEIKLEELIGRFPNIEHSYMNISDMKVNNSEYLMAVPQGVKCYLWFTYYKDEYVALCCYLAKGKIYKICKILSVFDSTLCSGTIFFCTLFHYRKTPIIYIENICFYKGKNIINEYFSKKIKILEFIFENEINIEPLIDKQTIIGIGLIYTNKNDLLKNIELYPCKIRYIQYITKNTYNNCDYNPHSYDMYNNSAKAVFKIKADLQNDIYNLYCYNNGSFEHFIDVACIPDYQTSVYMNSLFRYIKENENLDKLEESDSEDEFENIDEDRFVDLKKSFNIECVYNHRFKKWVPLKICRKGSKIINIKELNIMRQKNFQIIEKNSMKSKKYF